jgi:hypothetical protein
MSIMHVIIIISHVFLIENVILTNIFIRSLIYNSLFLFFFFFFYFLFFFYFWVKGVTQTRKKYNIIVPFKKVRLKTHGCREDEGKHDRSSISLLEGK